MDTSITTPKPKVIRLKPKQKKTLEYWTFETSETYGNLYASAVKAGFRPSYALNLTSLKPSWLYETMGTVLEVEHIKQGIQNIAMSAPNSKSPDDTRLKAYETLARVHGMLDNKQQVNVTVVQPILDLDKLKVVDSTVIDQIPESHNE